MSGKFVFSYADDEWRLIAARLRPSDDAETVRARLEEIARRYLVTTASDSGTLMNEETRKQRQRIRDSARQFIDATDGVGGETIGLGIVLDANGNRDHELTQRCAAEELSALRHQMSVVNTWIAADDMKFLSKQTPAEKPHKGYLTSEILKLWTELGRSAPSGGGNPNGPTCKFLMDAANPVLARGPRKSDRINSGEAARKIIAEWVENRAQ